MTSKRWILIVLLVAAAVVLVSCSSEPAPTTTTTQTPTKPAEPKKPTLSTGQDALEKMAGYAQKQWAVDALPVKLESEMTGETDGKDGKATVWKAVFVSQSRAKARFFSWSGSLAQGAPPQGVMATAGEFQVTPDLLSGAFNTFLVKTDTDKAYSIAQEHGGDAIMKKDPKVVINYALEFDRKNNAPLWVVIYGESLKKNEGYGVINGLTGVFMKGGKISG